MKTPVLLTLALGLFSFSGALADNLLADTIPAEYPEQIQQKKLIENTKVITIGKSVEMTKERRDSIEALISIFYINQYRHFQDPKAPFLMFMSKENDFAMGIGGTIRMRGWFDWDGSIDANGFCPYLISIPKDPTRKYHLGGTPAGTALVFTVFGNSPKFGKYLGYIQTDFNGYKGVGFRLKKAYVILNDWTVGYATSTFCDPATVPPTIDGAGPNGEATKTNILVRYFHTFKSGWSVAGGVELPSTQPRVDDQTVKKCADYVPDIAALVQYQWDGGMSHVRLSGLLRVMSYRDLLNSKNYNVVGWGAQLSAVWKVVKPFTLFGQVNVGQGHASYLNDLSIDSFDLVPKTNELGRLYAPTSVGITAGAQVNFLPNLFACLALGEMRFLPRTNPHDSSYKYGLYSAVNLFWDITPRFEVGGEYLWGRRKDFNGERGDADRVTFLFQMSF